jgi:SAM-dependent methyltransferase
MGDRSTVAAVPTCPACAAPLDGGDEFSAPDRHHGVPGDFSVRVCPRCGSGRTLPEVPEGELGGLYPAGYNAHTAPPGPPARLASRAIRRLQGWHGTRTPPLDALRERPGARVLDVGCGRGDLAVERTRRGFAVVGVEPSDGAATEAEERGVDVRRGTLRSAPLRDGEAFDAVVFQHSLEHTNEPTHDLRAARDALKPGGLVLIAMPHFGSREARRFRSRWYHLDVPRHRAHFTAAGLRAALEDAGLTIERIGATTSSVGFPATAQYAIFGRCLFPTGLALRVATALCALILPLSKLAGRDVLWAVARR